MDLRQRLTFEQGVLLRDGLSQFSIRFDSARGLYYIWGEHRTNSGKPYVLWSPIPNTFPYGRPPLYIWSPNPLLAYGGGTVNSYGTSGTSHDMHTLRNGPNGEVQICHWRDERWHSGITLNKVLLKGMLWLEAYEQHMATGRPIKDFVGTMAPA